MSNNILFHLWLGVQLLAIRKNYQLTGSVDPEYLFVWNWTLLVDLQSAKPINYLSPVKSTDRQEIIFTFTFFLGKRKKISFYDLCSLLEHLAVFYIDFTV